jgi:uncharacterized protein YndB with AHSA1/START domain
MASSSETKDSASVERVIPATPEAIFALIADPARHKEIDGSGTVRDAKNVPQELTLGAKFGMSMKLGVPYSMVSTVIEYEPGRRLAWQTFPPIGARIAGGRIWRYELEPVDGGTRVRFSLAAETRGFAKLMSPGVTRAVRSETRAIERLPEAMSG